MIGSKGTLSLDEGVRNLATQIRDSAQSETSVETELATSQRIIARVTDGIYREPWAAFRELIANAYDADATHVVVETGAPEFDQIIVRDDGAGMSPDALAYVIRNIGGSSKRTRVGIGLSTARRDDEEKSPGGRPLIGKIGIGLFAVAQLTQHFQIITKAAGQPIRMSATVRLHTHDDENRRGMVDSNEYIAGRVTVKSEKVPDNELNGHGTTVVLYSLRPEIRRTLQSVRRWSAVQANGHEGEPVTQAPTYHIGLPAGVISKSHGGISPRLPWEYGDSPTDKFQKLYDAAGNVSGRGTRPANLEHFDEYLKLVWQISLSLPLDYVAGHPFDLDGSSGLIFYDVPDGPGQARRITLSADESIRSRVC